MPSVSRFPAEPLRGPRAALTAMVLLAVTVSGCVGATRAVEPATGSPSSSPATSLALATSASTVPLDTGATLPSPPASTSTSQAASPVPVASSARAPAPFVSTSRPLSAAEQRTMTGVSWHPGCPVPLSDLRRLTVTFVDFDGLVRQGVLVVHTTAVTPLVQVFRELYEARFPIRTMQPVETYGGDDWTSIEADNTSAFNCRLRTGSATEWSRHSYGLALDLNPLENPYVTDGATSHPRSRPYLDRSNARPGMITAGSVAVTAFARVGWSWGGSWQNPIDLQHFSDNGR